jgi:hypothetical protein
MTDNSLPEKPAPDEPVAPLRGTGARKGKRRPARRPVKGTTVLKPRQTTGKPGSVSASAPAGRPPHGDQIPARRRARGRGRYVRFRVHVDQGQPSIVDSHLVDSPLMMPSTLRGAYAYEVTRDARLLHADSIPDLGVFRSFPDPHGTPEQRGHHIDELSSYDFDVRVPADELTPDALPNIAIVLHRVKEQPPARALSAQPLAVQFERELRELTRVEGIPARLLPPALRRPTQRTARRKRSS